MRIYRDEDENDYAEAVRDEGRLESRCRELRALLDDSIARMDR